MKSTIGLPYLNVYIRLSRINRFTYYLNFKLISGITILTILHDPYLFYYKDSFRTITLIDKNSIQFII